MVLRFCYKKYPTFSTKQTITQLRNILAVKPKYPGVLFQQYVPQRLMSTVTISNKIEKIENKSVQTDNFDQLLNNQLTPKQTKSFYRRLSKKNPTEIFNLFTFKLDLIDYKKLRQVYIDASSYWSIETIQQIMLLCNNKYVPWKLDLLQSLQSNYNMSKNINDLLPILPKSGPMNDILPFYNIVLNKCLKQKQYDDMYIVMKLMKENNINPDIATCNILMRMKLINCETPEETIEIYKEIIKERVKPNHATFNTLIKHTCQNQHWNNLSILLNYMKEQNLNPNQITIRILFKSYIEYPTIPQLIESFDIVSKSIPIKEREKLLNNGITKLIKLKETNTAMNLLDKTFELNESISIYSYNLLLNLLCLEGKLETAQQVLNSMIVKDNIPKPDIVSFTTIIHGIIRNNNQIESNEIKSIYNQLLQQDLRSNNVLQSVILYGLIKSNNNDISNIKKMFDLIINNKNRNSLPRLSTDKPLDEMNIYNMMIDFYFLHYHHNLRDQIPKEPFNLLHEAVELKKLKPTISTLNIFVRGLAILNKDLIGAEKILSLLNEKGVHFDEKTIWYLTKSAYNQGQFTKARKWIELFESKNNIIQGSGLNNLKSILTKWDSK